jgi:hypothetical protein
MNTIDGGGLYGNLLNPSVTVIIGDSIGHGLYENEGGRGRLSWMNSRMPRSDLTRVGRSPGNICKAIERNYPALQHAIAEAKANGKEPQVIISVGASNTKSSQEVDRCSREMFALLEKAGIKRENIHVIGVGPDGGGKRFNDLLTRIAREEHVHFTGALTHTNDGVHPQSYTALFRDITQSIASLIPRVTQIVADAAPRSTTKQPAGPQPSLAG